MNENNDRLKTASRLKNWIACNYTTINEINKKDLKKKQSSTTEKIRKEIKWKPKINLINGMNLTFKWYLNNLKYYSSIQIKEATKGVGLNIDFSYPIFSLILRN